MKLLILCVAAACGAALYRRWAKPKGAVDFTWQQYSTWRDNGGVYEQVDPIAVNRRFFGISGPIQNVGPTFIGVRGVPPKGSQC